MTLSARVQKLEKNFVHDNDDDDQLGCILLAATGDNDEEIERICAEREAMAKPGSSSVHTIILVPGKKG